MLEDLVANFQVFVLIFARILGLLRIAPLLSTTAIPAAARNGLALLTAFIAFPAVNEAGYAVPAFGLEYGALVLGEALIGVIMGFFLMIMFSTFQLSAQYFSLQMGFGASETFDPLSQIEIPVVGELLNLIAMYIFISTEGFSKIFLVGVTKSFEAMRAVDLVTQREFIFTMFLGSLGQLFIGSLVISFPIFGSLFLVQVVLGLLAKAAPQMNLLTLGFPVSTGVAFMILLVTLPFLAEAFTGIVDSSLETILRLFDAAWRARA